MNKKQLLSITMLLSVVSLSAGIPSGGINAVLPADGYAAAKAARIAKSTVEVVTGSTERAALENTVSSLRTDLNSLMNNKEAIAELQALSDAEQAAKVGMFGNAWTATKNGAQYSWDAVKAAPFIAWNGVKATPGAIQTGTSDAYTFAKANPTASAVRTGAIAGAGYVAYRQAGNVTSWIKENPKKAATLVALAGLGYYKGDVALTAAKSLVGQLPARPDFVNTGLGYVSGTGSTVASYLPARPDFVNTGLGYVSGAGSTVVGSVSNNPYTAAAYAATAAQGVSDYVGLGSEEETATETVVANIAENKNLFTLKKASIKIQPNNLSNDELIVKLQETRNWASANLARARFLPIIDSTLAELS